MGAAAGVVSVAVPQEAQEPQWLVWDLPIRAESHGGQHCVTSCACVQFGVFILSLAFSRMEQVSLGKPHQECDSVDLGFLAALRASGAFGASGLS